MTQAQFNDIVIEQEMTQVETWAQGLGLTAENSGGYTLVRMRDNADRVYMLYRGRYPGGEFLGALKVTYTPQQPVERPLGPDAN